MLEILDYRVNKKALLTPGKTISPEMLNEEFFEKLEVMKQILIQDGVGLAATQVGWDVRLFLLAIDDEGETLPEPLVCINPKILSLSSSKIKEDEGCLSFPGLFLKIKRPESVTWEYQTLNGDSVVEKSRKLKARAVQHEVDHLNGSVFINLASSAQKIRIKKWLKHK